MNVRRYLPFFLILLIIGFFALNSKSLSPGDYVTDDPPFTGKCAVAGCQNELCLDEATAYRRQTECLTILNMEFACYENAICEIQPEGECGWTMTQDLTECLENAEI